MAVSMIAGGSVGVWALHQILDLGGGAARIGVELAFLAAVVLLLGGTMPQRSGKPPFQQWSEGVRPTRASARRGFGRLGVDPDGAIVARVAGLFPRR
jgi:hypothetical protein